METGKDLETETDLFGGPKVDTEEEDVDASFSSDQQNGHLEGWQSRRLRPFWSAYSSLCTPSFIFLYTLNRLRKVCGGGPGHETTICWEIPTRNSIQGKVGVWRYVPAYRGCFHCTVGYNQLSHSVYLFRGCYWSKDTRVSPRGQETSRQTIPPSSRPRR